MTILTHTSSNRAFGDGLHISFSSPSLSSLLSCVWLSCCGIAVIVNATVSLLPISAKGSLNSPERVGEGEGERDATFCRLFFGVLERDAEVSSSTDLTGEGIGLGITNLSRKR